MDDASGGVQGAETETGTHQGWMAVMPKKKFPIGVLTKFLNAELQKQSLPTDRKLVDIVSSLGWGEVDKAQAWRIVASKYLAANPGKSFSGGSVCVDLPSDGSESAKTKAKVTKAKRSKTATPTPSRSFYWSDEWRKLRYQVIRENDSKCMACGRSPKLHSVIMHVDHIKPISKFPELKLEKSNLQILCDDCNLGKGNTDSIDWRPDNHVFKFKDAVIDVLNERDPPQE